MMVDRLRRGLLLMIAVAMLACVKTTPMALTRFRQQQHRRLRVVGDFIGGTGARANATGPWEPNQVRNLVAERGGTDVVFDPAATGHIIGRGYRCK